MFSKVLIANRGEIAVRIIRACRELGIRTAAVFSQADADALHVQLADEAVCIGPPQAAQSYLKIAAIISAAEITGAEAIHPGYGFLAENPHFAEVCEGCGIRFIGPSASSIQMMGDKAAARRMAAAQGVPVLPGSQHPVRDLEEARRVARDIGYPVIIKASAGGGGKGMRVVAEPEALESSLATAAAEAAAAFGDAAVYLERYLPDPRHVEIQVLMDGQGQGIHLGERDCSIQRRHQKLLEEAPSPALTDSLRQAMGRAALSVAQAAGYRNAGTVEFLLDELGNFYFMEMNTRIQVEHPVTEMVTGLDLVKAQLRIAAGEPLPVSQAEVRLTGHSLECRINAEDPDRFLPSPGRLTNYRSSGGPGVRVDSHAYVGYVVPPYYDSLLGKLIVHGCDRGEAIARMQRALDETQIQGVQTTIPFHQKVLRHPDFLAGRTSTRFLERLLQEQ
ncbi:MAG: acetyl-CoA carboxylase biotin carboxylase subunit [candidate division NC10 bacterium]|nr:acetyl-CoA carboxylase biotin carboxylase subunit [candidate division NC10 bacterium]MBI2458087.1 acetyl-CoA carboxylase biotin carboxylase subunit [candidate division NC10 bacterium]MBI2561813.1 acetyl-CoA carboxylase biotin carboxylase subunit [candidate division NC10 bacterium]